MSKFKIIDLFSWCWWLSLWFEKAGLPISSAYDNWKPAIENYRENFAHPIYDLDLWNEDNYKFIANEKPDIIIGWPPCQDFSSAWKRNENWDKADLTISYANIIKYVKPKYFIMENVSRITKTGVLKRAIDIFKESGYWLTQVILDASYCWVPQSRKRFILVWWLNENDDFMLEAIMENYSNSQMTINDYLWNTLWLEHYYRHPRSYARRWIFSIYEPSPTIRWVNRPLPENYTKHEWDSIDPQIYPVRALTTMERTYIQTFPKEFKWVWTKTNLEQVIWNAVPVNLWKFIGLALKKYLETKSHK